MARGDEYEDEAAFAGAVVPAWSSGVERPPASAVSLAPWRRAPAVLSALLVDELSIVDRDVFVDLGSGDGSLVIDVARCSGCRGVGVDASADLVGRSRRAAAGLDRVRFLHELIGVRGLAGATVVFAWLLPPAFPVVSGLVAGAAAGSLRAFASVGLSGPESSGQALAGMPAGMSAGSVVSPRRHVASAGSMPAATSSPRIAWPGRGRCRLSSSVVDPRGGLRGRGSGCPVEGGIGCQGGEG